MQPKRESVEAPTRQARHGSWNRHLSSGFSCKLRKSGGAGPSCRQHACALSSLLLIDRVDVRVDQVDIHLRPTRLGAIFDVAVAPSQGALNEETLILSVPARLRRAGMETRMPIDGTDPFAVAKPDPRLIKLLARARRFSATLVESDGVPFSALAVREGVCRSYFTRVVRLSYLAPDITQAILEGRQPRDLTAEKLLDRSRLPGRISGLRLVLLKPDPNSQDPQASLNQSKPDLIWGPASRLQPNNLSRPHRRKCGTGIWPDRDIAAGWRDGGALRLSADRTELHPRERPAP